MLKLIGSAALAASLAFASASSAFSADAGSIALQPTLVVAEAPAAVAVPAAQPAADTLEAHEHGHDSGLAPGQTAADYNAWLAASPANRASVRAFRDRLARSGS